MDEDTWKVKHAIVIGTKMEGGGPGKDDYEGAPA